MLSKLKLNVRRLIDVFSTCEIHEIPGFIRNLYFLKKEIGKKIEPLQKFRKDNLGESYEKYLDIDYWIFETLLRCYTLGLPKSDKKLKILDIGTGNGYFPYMCQYFGHDAESIDVGIIELYDLVIAALGVKRYVGKVMAFQNLDVIGKYDLITAFMVCFNGHKSDELWHIKEWKYFINSLHENNLLNEGKIYLSLNLEDNSEEPISKSLLSFFSNNGAQVISNNIYIEKTYNYND